MLIRGGANYAFEQVNAELAAFLSTQYPALATEKGTPSFAVAVCVFLSVPLTHIISIYSLSYIFLL